MASTDDLAAGIRALAAKIGADPVDLGTVISYETGGTFNPAQPGPRTQWGQHRGLIQWGEPQAAKYGVDFNGPVSGQLEAVGRYLQDAGFRPGMSRTDMYSAINAGHVGRNNASDANNGGAPGTVADKVNNQMAAHEKKALALLGGSYAPSSSTAVASASPQTGPSTTFGALAPDASAAPQGDATNMLASLLQAPSQEQAPQPLKPIQFAAPQGPSLAQYLAALQGAA